MKINAGTFGTDQQSIEDFEGNLSKELYKIWNCLASGSYFPPPVRAVEIPRRSGGVQVLGIPALAERIAQTAVKTLMEPRLEAIFDTDLFAYCPDRSVHDALTVTKRRCWGA